MKNALVLTSGGVDSTTALALAIEKYGSDHVIALSISYGQKHTKELEAAKAVAAHYGVEQRFLDLALIFKDSNCSLLEGSTEEIPGGQLRRADRRNPRRNAGQHLCALPQRPLSVGGCEHCPEQRLRGHLLRRPCRRRSRICLSRLFADFQQRYEHSHLRRLRPSTAHRSAICQPDQGRHRRAGAQAGRALYTHLVLLRRRREAMRQMRHLH